MQENFDFSGDSSSSSDNKRPIEKDQPLETTSHFWVVDDDYFNSTLILTPSGEGEHKHQIKAVSYTHLTLPTNREV